MARQDEFEHVIVNEPGQLDRTVDLLEAVLARTRPA